MKRHQIRRLVHLALLLPFILSLSACSGFHYKDYDAPVDKENTYVLDLSDKDDNAAIIYFDSRTYRTLGIPFHTLFLATRFNGKRLSGAGSYGFLDVRGYQILKVPAGVHTIDYCWITTNILGSGGSNCYPRLEDIPFEAGKEYLVTGGSHGIAPEYKNDDPQIAVNSWVIDLETGKRIFKIDEIILK